MFTSLYSDGTSFAYSDGTSFAYSDGTNFVYWQAAAAVIFVFCLLALSLWFYKVTRGWDRLIGRVDKESLNSVLDKLHKGQETQESRIGSLEQTLRDLQKESLKHVQKVGLVRFNPYGDTGGNQSFALAILDGGDSGVVILSLHGREGTRTYVKEIKKGKSSFQLSGEEKRAIEHAVG